MNIKKIKTVSFQGIEGANSHLACKKLFPKAILGLSDHTFGHSTVLGAIALGARVFEKHFTDDNSREGPDHKFALNPVAWREMVDISNEVFETLGDGLKKVEENEHNAFIVQRRSIVCKSRGRCRYYFRRFHFKIKEDFK